MRRELDGRTPDDERLEHAARRLLGKRRLIIATNRGPVSFAAAADGSIRPRRGSGGLVTALGQLGRYVPVTWVAAAMSDGDRRAADDPALLDGALGEVGIRLRFARVRQSVHDAAYNVIANPLLWFLQHQMWSLPERPAIDLPTMRAWEHGYVRMNEAMADAVVAQAEDDPEPRIMLHDYHLYLAAETIRRRRPGAVVSHFTHIPWPPSSLWQVMPPSIREEIMRGMCANDVVGFQTERYAHNFLRSAESFLPGAEVDYDRSTVRRAGHETRVRRYPISIDVASTRRTVTGRRAERLREQLRASESELLIVRVDRLEPSKNIVRGFAAFETLLARYPRYRSRVRFLAFLVPSRTGLREYGDYGRTVQAAVERINARFARGGYRPVRIFFENDYPQAMAGLSVADVVLVNPLIDGMNLVAKEAAVVSGRDAAIVLSETAGAYDQMADGVIPVAPADVVGTADALRAGLEMPRAERAARLAHLRAGIEREPIRWWLAIQLADLVEVADLRAVAPAPAG
jgi:trehalose 6-phosphate synthase